MDNGHGNEVIMPLVTRRVGLPGSYSKWSQQQRREKKKKQMMSLQSKIEKTDTGEIIYNTKRDWLSNKNK